MPITTTTTPSRLGKNSTPGSESDARTPREYTPVTRDREISPTRGANANSGFGGILATSQAGSTDNNSLSKLQPPQVRELREGFQTLDRDSDGHVGREDVADMLTQLGMSSNPADLTAFFPPSTPQTVTLPAYLNSLASLLATLSPSSELLSAFSAFDEDDSGQIDLREMKDALMQTAPEPGVQTLSERDIDRVMNGFTGRRAFGKQSAGGMGKRGEVFKYQEFVSSIQGDASRENDQNE
ncbi:Myosin regulatory light chain 1 [Hyphodiscus hymeniophilus]|uniref:Myosin regulatory light chain 1 n=1 Tax=Hyphodiscus hymeniophilus TaxID=353542 RepID=A0A9P6VFH2_9HELO|nr:Myosin regulatory light chain 1 [Hyphodiscus hymeniophilus]